MKKHTKPVTRWYRFDVRGVSLEVADSESSRAVFHIVKELELDQYGIEQVPFSPGDIVLDIGGHIGLFSIYLAKRHPDIRIYAFEPVPDNHSHFVQNLAANNVSTVRLFNKALTSDGRLLKLHVHLDLNSAGASAYASSAERAGAQEYVVESVTLDRILHDNGITKCKFLKMDCEGAEYEILLSTNCWAALDYLGIEIHVNNFLRRQGYSSELLLDYCKRFLAEDHIRYTVWHGPFTAVREHTTRTPSTATW